MIFIVVAALVAVLWVLRKRYMVVTVRGYSMRPSYLPGDKVLVRRIAAARIRRGQAVVFEAPGRTGEGAVAEAAPGRTGEGTAAPVPPGSFVVDVGLLIKRAVATGGDQVDFPVPGAGPVVPAGHLAVRGDNVDESFDSRDFGYVPPERVVGVVLRRLGAP
ncbi:S26 family signal peptidase [Nonomuraea jabiensis]|uniref:S26 family signal peptidase n=1 Tax=Nonomuraea jabiensis TaxID=882448 RepID=UPI003D74F20F